MIARPRTGIATRILRLIFGLWSGSSNERSDFHGREIGDDQQEAQLIEIHVGLDGSLLE
jgi:hypothetical protein